MQSSPDILSDLACLSTPGGVEQGCEGVLTLEYMEMFLNMLIDMYMSYIVCL